MFGVTGLACLMLGLVLTRWVDGGLDGCHFVLTML